MSETRPITVGAMRIGGSTPAASWLIAGVVVSGAGAAVQLKRVAPHPRFNHNDLYHVIQVAALYLFYRVACCLSTPDRIPVVVIGAGRRGVAIRVVFDFVLAAFLFVSGSRHL